ncbi:MAG: hypothetical protein IT198_16330 [Acidimicrobiia bacterium]|nr:hypothetical protein [Acidimicrobiia bacterium]
MTAPITAYVGLNGHGKTLAMVVDLVRLAEATDRAIVSNFPIYTGDGTRRRHPLWEPLATWRQIPDLHDSVLLLDEITACIPSRQSMSLPAGLARTLNQLRKVNVTLGWTAPSWARADVILREVTQVVVHCRGLVPGRWIQGLDGERHRAVPGWAPRRVFWWREYDAYEFEDFTRHVRERLRPRRHRLYVRPWHRDHLMYETGAEVHLLDHLDDVGVCVVCGGSRRRARCTCVPATSEPASDVGGAGPRPKAGEAPPRRTPSRGRGRHDAPSIPPRRRSTEQTTGV